MNSTWLIVLGILAAGAAVFLLLPQLFPEQEPTLEIPAVVDVAPNDGEPEPVAAIDGEGDEEDAQASDDAETTDQPPTSAEVSPSITGYSIDGEIGGTEYAHSTEIAGVKVYWTNDAAYLRVGLVAPGTGYVSIGFGPTRRMEGANFILGYVEDGKSYFRDDFGIEATGHIADTDRGGVDNIVSSAGAEWIDQTILEFIIPLDSGDAMDVPMSPGRSYTILVAYHDLQDGFTARHSRRGTGEIQLDTAP